MLTIGIHGVADPSGLGRSHDHGVAVMRGGRVLFLRELERDTGEKHDGRLGQHLESLLSQVLHGNEDATFVLANSFLGASLQSSGGAFRIDGQPYLDVPQVLTECDGRVAPRFAPTARFFCLCHEMAHLGTCLPFFGGFLPNSLLVHVDGGASRSCASAWFFDGRKLECLDFGWHAELKGAVNNFNASALSREILGVPPSAHLSMPGKLMGLARMAEPDAHAADWLARHDWLRDSPLRGGDLLEALKAALPELGFRELSPRDHGCQVLASSMQAHVEAEVLGYIRRFQKQTDAARLYYSGGAALNVHANARIESELGFGGGVFIPPAPSDTGLALGAAAYFAWASGERIELHSPFLNSLGAAAGAPHARKPETEAPSRRVRVVESDRQAAQAIADGRVVAVWGGAGEVGPRALGHRSLLLRPDSVALRRRVSERMKQREWYRPVAPMMLPEVAAAALEGYRPGSPLAAFMLGAWRVKPEWRQAFSGCVHADSSVRAQVVPEGADELGHIHRLLRRLREEHGIEGVINTSFNRRGQPIVHTWDQALDCAEEMGVDVLWSF